MRRTFVLVHGAWHGGWCWRRVADRLADAGHRVFTPTLTGLGERSHLLDAKTDLATHITDVVNVLRWEGLERVVLCGHSYGGFVISGVVERMEEKIAAMVFVDALVPETGESAADSASAAARERIAEALGKGAATVDPVPAAVFAVNAQDRAWVDRLCTPQPLATLTQQALLSGARERIARKVYVRATGYPSPAFDAALAKASASPSWRAVTLECGHDVMVDRPGELAEILLAAL
jgi:pimeloyl-ACP methyl ester carboxylesterase